MELWQITCGTIAVSDERQALIALCEEQESTIEDLRYELGEANDRADDAELETSQRDDELRKIEKERDAALEKLEAVEAIVNELKTLFV